MSFLTEKSYAAFILHILYCQKLELEGQNERFKDRINSFLKNNLSKSRISLSSTATEANMSKEQIHYNLIYFIKFYNMIIIIA